MLNTSFYLAKSFYINGITQYFNISNKNFT